MTVPTTTVRQVRTISFCFLYLTIIPNPPLPVKGEFSLFPSFFPPAGTAPPRRLPCVRGAPHHSLPFVKGGGERSEPEGLPTQTMPSFISPSAARSFTKGIHLYAYPAGAYFCSCKSRQNTLGAVPQDPLTLKLRLDTNDVNIVRTAPQIRSQGACGAFYFGFC